MGELLELIKDLQGLGVGALALLFLYITNKWWVAQVKERETKHEADKKQIRDDFTVVIDAKDTVISDLSGQLRDAMQQSRNDMERQMQRQVDSAQRAEETISANTNAMTNLQELVRNIPRGGA